MTAVLFHPHWARTLRQVADSANASGGAKLRVPANVDMRIVEIQVDQFLQAVGSAGRVDVIRAHPAGSKRATS